MVWFAHHRTAENGALSHNHHTTALLPPPARAVLMSHKDKHTSKHAAKKAAILARNKKHTLINEQADFHEDNRALQRKFEEGVVDSLTAAPAPTGTDGDVVWSAKLQEVRNRLSGKKRMASDRWNRFAGTAGGGGRGR
ncbi:MAG: hypothetical protein C0436_01740 [Alphaproteobacteria bacterium]|nr:hypothetical protein [Alphaproteobacteria bacterium]